MRVSPAGIALIKQFEGRRLTAYKCPAGIWTIGYGHTTAAGPPAVEPGMTITRAEADASLRQDLIRVCYDVEDRLKVELEQNQFDVLVSFVFNLGIGRFESSTLLKRVNARRFSEVPAELMKWTKARDPNTGDLVDLPGLVRRRRAEAALWRAVDDSADIDVDESRATPEPVPPPKTMAQSKEGNGAILAGAGSAAGVAAGAGQVLDQLDQATSTARGITRLMDSLPFWLLVLGVAGVLAAVGVWYWRRSRLKEEGA